MKRLDLKLIILLGIKSTFYTLFFITGYLQNMKQPNDYVYGITVPEYNFAGVTGKFCVLGLFLVFPFFL